MINIGHSPTLLHNVFLWLWHEGDFTRQQVEKFLEDNGVKINRTTIYQWLNENNKACWQSWHDTANGLEDILNKYGMSLADFEVEPTYTPNNLKRLRENCGMTLDKFAEKTGIQTKDLLLYEHETIANKKGLSYNEFQSIIKKLYPQKNKHDYVPYSYYLQYIDNQNPKYISLAKVKE